MAFSVRSMVSMVASAVTPSSTRPARADAARLAGELGQRAQHRPRDRLGHQGLQEVLLERALKAREHREGAEHRQHHREQRHQRDQRREGQAAGGEAQAVFAKTLAQRAQRVVPGPVAQRLQQFGPFLRARPGPPEEAWTCWL
jgi:hypothetical protein